MLRAAKTIHDEEARGIHIKRDNPFKNPWGLQADWDLWQQAWQAIRKRGYGNQEIRKAKRHATEHDIERSLSTRQDKDGNDKNDTNADEKGSGK